MVRLAYDLHIHSCLSPCGDGDMTPANLVNMAKLKELDVIAVTDHNSCKNCPAVIFHAEELGILAIPGMELCTMEEVHVLCLFPNLTDAMAFDEYVSEKLMKIRNKEEVFGSQEIYDKEDNCIGTESYLLINATEISFSELGELMKRYHGIHIPAHIEKDSNSLFSNLGFIPPDATFTCAELRNIQRYEDYSTKHPYLQNCKMITNSDAHYLEHINERINFLDVKDKTREAVIEALVAK